MSIKSLRARLKKIKQVKVGDRIVNVIIKDEFESVYRCGGVKFETLEDAQQVNPHSKVIEIFYY